jgi:hypothetical protein
MSDEWLNIRIGVYHLHGKRLKFRITRNEWHKENKFKDGYYKIYQLWPFI